MQVKKQQLEPDMEQQTGSKFGKEFVKAVFCHAAYLTYMWCTAYEMLGWMKLKLESRLQGEILITSDMQITQPLQQKAIEKAGLKLTIQKMKIKKKRRRRRSWHLVPSLYGK